MKALSVPEPQPRWLALVHILAIHSDQIKTHGGSPGLRDRGLLESALERPRNRIHYEPDTDLPALAAAYGEDLEVDFAVAPRSQAAPEPVAKTPKTHKKTFRDRLMRRAPSPTTLNPRFVFDRFIVGPSNNFAFAAAQAVAQIHL